MTRVTRIALGFALIATALVAVDAQDPPPKTFRSGASRRRGGRHGGAPHASSDDRSQGRGLRGL